MKRIATGAVLVCVVLGAGLGAARAADPELRAAATPPQEAVAPAPAYSLPWQLRPVTVSNVVRTDNSVAFYQNPKGDEGSTVASMLTGTFKVGKNWAPLVRLGAVENSEPSGATVGNGSAFLNPILGVTYAHKLSDELRGAAFLGTALPLGTGGSKPAMNDPAADSLSKGIGARAAMDNSMFAVNYAAAIGGLDVAYLAHKLTVQGEATLFQLWRTRNDSVAKDSSKTNLTAGLHVGYFALSFLSIGAELRHQRWLSTPIAVAANPATRDTTTVAFGPRFHVKLGGVTLRPGISFAMGLDKPLTDASYRIVQVDVPVVF